MSVVKKITALSMTAVIVAACLTGCGDYNTEDMSDLGTSDTLSTSNSTEDITESQQSEIPDESISVPETYEDYMKLAAAGYENGDWEIAHDCYLAAKELDGSRAEVYRGLSDTYLQLGDVIQALDILDEGMGKCGSENGIDLLGQRKEYILAGMVAVGTNTTTNRYDDDGSILYECVWEGDTNGNEKRDQTVYYDEMGEIIYLGEHKYDRNGNQIEYKYREYDSDGNLSNYFHKAWEYDADGKEVGNIDYDANDNIQDRTEYDYDIDGKLIRETCYFRDGEIYRQRVEEIEYDSSGNEIKREQNNAYGQTAKIVSTYDENGKLIICVKYNDNGRHIYEKIKYEYDENGNNIKEIHYKNPETVGYWSERDLAYWMEYKYDENGMVIKKERHNSDGTVSWEYEYDENGREIKYVTYDGNGTATYWREYEYDDRGNKIRYKSYNSTGNLDYDMYHSKFDENDREIYYSRELNGIVTEKRENEYGEDGNIIKEILTQYDSDTGRKTNEEVSEYTYDDKGNMTKYDFISREGKEIKNFRWEREYDEAGRGTNFYLYDNEKAASYQSKIEYDENDRMISYMGYDKNGNVIVRRETEYDTSGKVIKENYYDADGNLIQYYEYEYDDFGNLTRQTMYENGVIKFEKQTSYEYHYIGNIDAEAVDFPEHYMEPEEYNLKQRDIFTRFLNGEEKVRYYKDEYNVQDGKIVDETITDLIDFEYIRKYNRTLEYTFLDMTGDGKEELIIFSNGDHERLCVIQCSYGVLKVIHDIDRSVFDVYTVKCNLVKCNGRTGVCHDCDIANVEDMYFYYFLGDERKNGIFVEDDERYGESSKDLIHFYSMNDIGSFKNRDITKGEYYDIMSGIVKMTDIDWYKLEDPDNGKD